MSDAWLIFVANLGLGACVLLVLKPLNDVRKDLAVLNAKLYKDFVTYERLNERFAERDEARAQERPARSHRRANSKRQIA